MEKTYKFKEGSAWRSCRNADLAGCTAHTYFGVGRIDDHAGYETTTVVLHRVSLVPLELAKALPYGKYLERVFWGHVVFIEQFPIRLGTLLGLTKSIKVSELGEDFKVNA